MAKRTALAETIAKIHEAEARIADNEARINSLFDKSFFSRKRRPTPPSLESKRRVRRSSIIWPMPHYPRLR